MSRSSYSNIATEAQTPSFDFIYKMCLTFNLSAYWLIFDTSQMFRKNNEFIKNLSQDKISIIKSIEILDDEIRKDVYKGVEYILNLIYKNIPSGGLMKKFLFAICIFMLGVDTYASPQQGDFVIGTMLGFGLNSQKLSDIEGSHTGVGFNANTGLNAEIFMHDAISFYTGIGINFRNNYSEVIYYLNNGTAWSKNTVDIKTRETFLSIPAVIRFYIPTGSVILFTGLGYQYNIKLYSSYIYTFSDNSAVSDKSQNLKKQNENCFIFQIGNRLEYDTGIILSMFAQVSACIKKDDEQINGTVKIGRAVIENDIMITVGKKI